MTLSALAADEPTIAMAMPSARAITTWEMESRNVLLREAQKAGGKAVAAVRCVGTQMGTHLIVAARLEITKRR
jgi:hypothetical protein